MLTLGVLCSGHLGASTLMQLVEAYPVAFVLTDRKSTSVIEFCEARSIPLFVGNPRRGAACEFVQQYAIDVLISVNYLFIIEEDLINHPSQLAFNIHGSLLPKYRGRTPHVWAIINNESEVGVTAHRIAQGCDTGDIIEQLRIPIEEDDTGNSLLEKYSKLYLPLASRVLQKLESGDLEYTRQDESKATYFEKRAPADGEINWDWYRERIRNWVRAQSDPYPGAFTFYDGEKVIIDQVSFTDAGFDGTTKNGTLIEVHPRLIVKTTNGAIALNAIRSDSIQFRLNSAFTSILDTKN